MRPTLLALVLAVAACGSGDRQATTTSRATPSTATTRGPDNLVLRVVRTGGTARVFAYPGLDSVVWSGRGAPAPARILAFDDEAGTIAYVDTRGYPARIDFRQDGTGVVSRSRLSSIASADGSSIYAITNDGVQRFSPSGTWKWKPPLEARALFPQPDGTLLVLAERKGGSVLWHVRPPEKEIADSVELPRVDRTLRTQVGDRLYLGAGNDLIGVRTRTMQRAATVSFDAPIEQMAATPSGDRVFVVTKDGTAVQVVDRYQEKVTGSIDLAHHAGELRMDPIGRYLLVEVQDADSALVIALGNNRLVGAVASAWRADLPFVAPDGSIALAQGKDVVLVDGGTLRPTATVRGGGADFWYAFRWTGFRPRDATLDQPVYFPVTIDTAPPLDSLSAADSASAEPPDTAAAPRDTVRRPTGFTVSFAALLSGDKARELAGRIHVGNETARVVTVMREGQPVYRVVLGPYSTRDEADRVGRESRQSYWIYEGGP
ncbi:MAG TPA: SPOR domain-containing protein [Gemmatimonadaceae bacterium]